MYNRAYVCRHPARMPDLRARPHTQHRCQSTIPTPIQRRYLDEACRGVLIYDGAMGTQILNLSLTADDYGGAQYDGCPEFLVVPRPDAIRDIHRAYLAAGA